MKGEKIRAEMGKEVVFKTGDFIKVMREFVRMVKEKRKISE